jgi:hypothetical protein
MNQAELAIRRSQLGKSARCFVATGPRSLGEQGPGYWVALSGAPVDDANMALVDRSDPATLEKAVGLVERAGFPTLFMLAGGGREADLGAGWKRAGDAPFMSCWLSGARLRRDSRVREAGVADFEVVSEIIADAFNLTRPVAHVLAGVLELPDTEARIWLLMDDGRPVSTVLTSIVDDVVCVWCAGTTHRFTRRGHCRALLGDVLSRAHMKGADIGLLVSTTAGKAFYDATGWTTLESWPTFTNARWAQLAG